MKRDNGDVGPSARAEQELDMSELETVSGGSLLSSALTGSLVDLRPIKVVFTPNIGSIIGGVARRC